MLVVLKRSWLMAGGVTRQTAGLRHGVCLTGLERSFSEVGSNIVTALYHLLATPSSSVSLFGVRPANDSWIHVRAELSFERLEVQAACEVGVPAWYGCQAHGRGDCRHNFVQELCDLEACERMISSHERATGVAFDTITRLRADAYWEARWSFPARLGAREVIVPAMDSGPSGVNDHLAFGGREGMRVLLLRSRQLHLNLTANDFRLLGITRPGKFKMFSEMYLRLVLARGGVEVVRSSKWMYCLHTKKALLDQRGVYGCIARLRARRRCVSLACGRSDVKYWCHCFNDTCAAVAGGKLVASLGPEHISKSVKVWKMRAGWACEDVHHSQLMHPGCPWRSHDYALNFPGVVPLRWPAVPHNASNQTCPGEVKPNNLCRLSIASSPTSACAPNVSFGCVDHDSMWTGKGCRAIFSCNGFRVRCGARVRNNSCYCTSTSSRLWKQE